MIRSFVARRAGRWVVAALVLVAAGAAPGCAPPKRLATLTGKVTYQGKPVAVGAIYFHGPAGEIAMGNLTDTGGFVATDVPVGEVRVSLRVQDPGVYSQQLQGTGGRGAKTKPKDEDKVTSVPAKYSDPATSGLAYTLTPGQTTLDVTIE